MFFLFSFFYLRSQKHNRDKDEDIVKQNEENKADNRHHKITNEVVCVAIPPVLICKKKWTTIEERGEIGGGAKSSAKLTQRAEFGAYIFEDKATDKEVELFAGRRSRKSKR